MKTIWNQPETDLREELRKINILDKFKNSDKR